MGHKVVGTATINGQVTTIREYGDGFNVVEVNGDVKYHGQTLNELEEKLEKDKVDYKITQPD